MCDLPWFGSEIVACIYSVMVIYLCESHFIITCPICSLCTFSSCRILMFLLRVRSTPWLWLSAYWCFVILITNCCRSLNRVLRAVGVSVPLSEEEEWQICLFICYTKLKFSFKSRKGTWKICNAKKLAVQYNCTFNENWSSLILGWLYCCRTFHEIYLHLPTRFTNVKYYNVEVAMWTTQPQTLRA